MEKTRQVQDERSGHLMGSDRRGPRPRATREEDYYYLTMVLNARGGIDPVESANACCHCWRRDSTTQNFNRLMNKKNIS